MGSTEAVGCGVLFSVLLVCSYATFSDGYTCSKDVDLALAIDTADTSNGKRGVGQSNCQAMMSFTSSVVAKFVIGLGRTRVGGTNLSDQANNYFALNSSIGTNLAILQKQLMALPCNGRSRNIVAGLDRLNEIILTPADGDRSGIPDVVLMVLTGESTVNGDQSIQEANNLKQRGVRVVVVGITDAVDEGECKGIASSSADVFFVKEFEQLTAIIDSVVERCCPTNTAGNDTGCSGSTGATGVVGATGIAGDTGATGVSGMPGTDGATGLTGATGAPGAVGIRGYPGATGASGQNGYPGSPGATGYTGATGVTGVSGATGASGMIGRIGLTGATGATGWSGIPGATGSTGMMGPVGPNGLVGYTGATGTTGQSGSQGFPGSPGSTGATGAPGLSGPAGVGGPGATGATGQPGTVGATGSPGAFAGQGATGMTGATGVTGQFGGTGGTGATGMIGLPGSTGAQGPMGYYGFTGATGAMGYPGPPGQGVSIVDKCLNNNGGCQQICQNTPESYYCMCSQGYTVAPSTFYNSNCNGVHTGNYYCQYFPDTRGIVAEYCFCRVNSSTILSVNGTQCIDDDECSRDNGGCDKGCINTPGSFQCSCPTGFTLSTNGKSCIDVDECAGSSSPCSDNSYCVNSFGSYVCIDQCSNCNTYGLQGPPGPAGPSGAPGPRGDPGPACAPNAAPLG